MRSINDFIENGFAFLVVLVVSIILVVATYDAIDKELTIREQHNHIHRHDLSQKGR